MCKGASPQLLCRFSQKEEGVPHLHYGAQWRHCPEKAGAGAAWGGPLEAWHWCQSRLTSARGICVHHFQITVTDFTPIS